MHLPRRQFLRVAAGAAALPALTRIARAQTYPTRPVRIIVVVPAGSSGDTFARMTAQWLSERLGQSFVIENRPGGGGIIGTEIVVRAAADGYTLLAVGSQVAINATLYEKLNFNFIRDVAPVAGIVRVPNAMVVNPALPAKTVPEFIAYAKANPGKLNMASAGNGTAPHVAGELFNMMAGVKMIHVPYRGGPPALTDLIAGLVQVYFGPIPPSIEHMRSGNLRGLAVTTAMRSDVLPDLPTVADFLPGFEASTFFGIGAPNNTPAEIVDRLNQEVNAALADPTFKARLADQGGTVLPGSPANFGKLIAEETDKWAKVIRFAGIKAP
jgi:tripartite-type tricarboxylate transporter receptor subunit TctC